MINFVISLKTKESKLLFNNYFLLTFRTAGQETDWQSTKDSGHGESEAGDLDSESGGDFSTSHNFLEDNFEALLGPNGSK